MVWLRLDDNVAVNPRNVAMIDADVPTLTVRFWAWDGITQLGSVTLDNLTDMQNWALKRFAQIRGFLRASATTAVNTSWISKVDVDSTTLRWWRIDGAAILAEKEFGTVGELKAWADKRMIFIGHEDVSPLPDPPG